MGLDRVTYNYESVTVGASAIGLTAAKYLPSDEQHAREAVCTVETNPVRFRVDADPSATEGELLNTGDSVTLDSIEDIRRCKFIRTGGASGTLKVRYAR